MYDTNLIVTANFYQKKFDKSSVILQETAFIAFSLTIIPSTPVGHPQILKLIHKTNF